MEREIGRVWGGGESKKEREGGGERENGKGKMVSKLRLSKYYLIGARLNEPRLFLCCIEFTFN